jgi:hypothetical protein
MSVFILKVKEWDKNRMNIEWTKAAAASQL